MSKTTVVNRNRKMDYDVYIGRPSKWGNPFSDDPKSSAKNIVWSREESIERYKKWLKTQPALIEALPELIGKRLGCWCKPKACHGDILADIANCIADGRQESLQTHYGIRYCLADGCRKLTTSTFCRVCYTDYLEDPDAYK